MKRALVTGSSGFIGKHLCKRLKDEGYWVKGVDIKRPEWGKPEVHEFQELDLKRYKNCEIAIAGSIDEVYHLAANMGGIGFIETHKAEIVRDNTLIDINMLEVARQFKVKKFFFSSSACVYPMYMQKDNKDTTGLKEAHAYPADAEDGYGWEKIYIERMCKHYLEDYKLKTYVARFHNIYGPWGTYKGGREKSPAALCRKIASTKNGEIEVWGDGKQTRSFCYIDDCVEGIYQLVQSDYHEPINIGSDRLVSIDEMIDIIAKIAGKEITKRYDTSKAQGVKGRNADLTLVKKVLGWKPEKSLEEGLKNTYNWIKDMIGGEVK